MTIFERLFDREIKQTWWLMGLVEVLCVLNKQNGLCHLIFFFSLNKL